MYTLKPLIFSCLCAAPTSRADLFSTMMESMNQHMQEMEAHMQNMQHMLQTRQAFKSSPAVTYTVSENDQNTQILFKGIQSDTELNAVMGDKGNHLTLQTPQGTINLRTKDRVLHVEITHKQEQTQDTKGNVNSAISMSSSSFSQLLAHKVTLENVSLEYDQETQQLTILIPHETMKQVPITIKRK